MALPDFSMRQLLEAGVHFGHQSHRWNPKMADYIFGARNNIHIIDLAQTVPLLHRALQAVSDTVAKGGRILFVGTKRQAQDGVAEAAKRSAQYFVNSRWLGGTLTNWKTVSETAVSALCSNGTVWARSMMWMLLRAPKMNSAIFGFQRCDWWPK